MAQARGNVHDVRGVTWLGVLLTVFDAAATWAWLTTGAGDELNPVVRLLIDTFGNVGGMCARAALGVSLVVGLAVMARRTSSAWPALVVVTGVLGLVSGWHTLGVVAVAAG